MEWVIEILRSRVIILVMDGATTRKRITRGSLKGSFILTLRTNHDMILKRERINNK